MNPANLKYIGEAIFLLGAAYHLLRWALGAFEEGDAPPSAFNASDGAAPKNLASLLMTPVSGLSNGELNPGGPQSGQSATITFKSSSPALIAKITNSLTQGQGLAEGPLAALFPQSMLDAMTPEQRAMVQATIASGLHVQPTPAGQTGSIGPVTFSTSPTARTTVTASISGSSAAKGFAAVDPALLQSMLATLSPEHRAQVMAMLAKQRDDAVKKAG